MSPDRVSVRPSLATLPEISTFLLCSPSSLPPGSRLCRAPVLVTGRVKVLSVWAPESRPFPALQCPSTLLPECPCFRRFLIQCPLQLCSPTHPHAPSLPFSQAASHPLQAPCSFLVSPSRPRLQPVLVVTALPRRGMELFLKEEQPFPSSTFVLEAPRGQVQASRASLLTSNLWLLSLVLKPALTPSWQINGLVMDYAEFPGCSIIYRNDLPTGQEEDNQM